MLRKTITEVLQEQETGWGLVSGYLLQPMRGGDGLCTGYVYQPVRGGDGAGTRYSHQPVDAVRSLSLRRFSCPQPRHCTPEVGIIIHINTSHSFSTVSQMMGTNSNFVKWKLTSVFLPSDLNTTFAVHP